MKILNPISKWIELRFWRRCHIRLEFVLKMWCSENFPLYRIKSTLAHTHTLTISIANKMDLVRWFFCLLLAYLVTFLGHYYVVKMTSAHLFQFSHKLNSSQRMIVSNIFSFFSFHLKKHHTFKLLTLLSHFEMKKNRLKSIFSAKKIRNFFVVVVFCTLLSSSNTLNRIKYLSAFHLWHAIWYPSLSRQQSFGVVVAFIHQIIMNL